MTDRWKAARLVENVKVVPSLDRLSCYGSQGQHQVLRQLVAMHLVHLQHHHILAVKVQSVCRKAVSQNMPSSGEFLRLGNKILILQAKSVCDRSKHWQVGTCDAAHGDIAGNALDMSGNHQADLEQVVALLLHLSDGLKSAPARWRLPPLQAYLWSRVWHSCFKTFREFKQSALGWQAGRRSACDTLCCNF